MYTALPDILADTPKIEKIPAPIIPPIPMETADNNPMGFAVFIVEAVKFISSHVYSIKRLEVKSISRALSRTLDFLHRSSISHNTINIDIVKKIYLAEIKSVLETHSVEPVEI